MTVKEATVREAAEFFAAKLREQKPAETKCAGIGPPVKGCPCSFCKRNAT